MRISLSNSRHLEKGQHGRNCTFASGIEQSKISILIDDMYIKFPYIHSKKRLSIFPSPGRVSLTKLSLAAPGVIKFFPAGDGKIDKLFLHCSHQLNYCTIKEAHTLIKDNDLMMNLIH